mmetsp:Transcript_49110/g.81625  ORF Transcript_49110/g.81625 Transcript_49110/m.81625 type:complete len:194 (-) Transcript_49110:44-625(-)
MNAITDMRISPDSHFLLLLKFHLYPQFPLVQAVPLDSLWYLETSCRVAGRDIMDEEWDAYGLPLKKDHPVCPGLVFTEGTCFGVPSGGTVSPNGTPAVIDVCTFESFSYMIQLSFEALETTTYTLQAEQSTYSTRIGVYDADCSFPALAYTTNTTVAINTGVGLNWRRINVIVSSTDRFACGTLRFAVTTRSP